MFRNRVPRFVASRPTNNRARVLSLNLWMLACPPNYSLSRRRSGCDSVMWPKRLRAPPDLFKGARGRNQTVGLGRCSGKRLAASQPSSPTQRGSSPMNPRQFPYRCHEQSANHITRPLRRPGRLDLGRPFRHHPEYSGRCPQTSTNHICDFSCVGRTKINHEMRFALVSGFGLLNGPHQPF